MARGYKKTGQMGHWRRMVVGRAALVLVLQGLSLFAACGASFAGDAAAHGDSTIVAQAEAAKIFHGVGKVVNVDAASGFVTIDHEDIPGLMDAMEMQFQAMPAKILEEVKVGDTVAFALDGKNWTILEIQKLTAAK
ncbi:copper-binding protein [Rhodoblastus sp.]|uniref:copper-binding protein n=1 Tax=Rhodoblastus sp. TaxID=1962975 RepID=UPI003F97A700